MQTTEKLSNYARHWVQSADASLQRSKYLQPFSQWCRRVCSSQEGQKVGQFIQRYGFVSLIGAVALAGKCNLLVTAAAASSTYLLTRDRHRCFTLKHSFTRDPLDMSLAALICLASRVVLKRFAWCYFTGFVGGYTLCHLLNPNLSSLGGDFEPVTRQMIPNSAGDLPAST